MQQLKTPEHVVTMEAALAARPGLATKLQMGLPHTLDPAAKVKLAENLESGNPNGVGLVLDDIFATNSYASMRQMFGP